MADITFTTGGDTVNLEMSDNLSIASIYGVLYSYMGAYEKELAATISTIEGSSANDIDQGTLLKLQAMVQTWGTVSAVSTGVVRLVGDTLMKITQNIR